MNNNPNDTSVGVAALVNQQGSRLGLSDDSSSTIIGNLGGSVTPMCVFQPLNDDEAGSDDHRIIIFVFDGSGSMEDVIDTLVESVNDILIPGLCEQVLDAELVGGLRIGGIAFGTRVQHLWGGKVQPIRSLPKLRKDECFFNSATALHQAILDAVTMAVAQSLQLSSVTGTNPEVTIAVLSDGANNQLPREADRICKVLQELSRELFTTVFIGFETWERVDFRAIAQSLGFREIHDSKAQPGETKEDMRRRFRNLMGVFSKQMIARQSTSIVGAKQAPDGSTGFWVDPD